MDKIEREESDYNFELKKLYFSLKENKLLWKILKKI
jgi:hypothetical protein